jgi:hypothetical protein
MVLKPRMGSINTVEFVVLGPKEIQDDTKAKRSFLAQSCYGDCFGAQMMVYLLKEALPECWMPT